MTCTGNASSTSMLGFRTKSQTLTSTPSCSQPAAVQASATSTTTATQPKKSRTGQNSVSLRRQGSQKVEAATLQVPFPNSGQTLQPEQLPGDFEDLVSGSDTAVLVDFYAPWCGPCELMSRVVAKLSKELKGDLKVVKVNADNYPKLANKYRVQALPTCLLFRDGILIDRVNGFMPEPSFGKRVRFYVARLDKKFGRR